MNRKKVSRNIKPAALLALRQSATKSFLVVAPRLQKDAEIFIWDVGLEPIVKKGRRTETGSWKKCQLGFSNLNGSSHK